jgi:hypothetical protein
MTGPSRQLVLADPQVRADLATYVSRARAADDGAVHFHATGPVLAAYVCILQPRALGEPVSTVLGLRTMALAEPEQLDVTVSLASVSDRLARLGMNDVVLPVPSVPVTANWAGVLPPRTGWQESGELPAEYLEQSAMEGIREVAGAVPSSPGAHVVHSARSAVWGRTLTVPAGAGTGPDGGGGAQGTLQLPAAAAFGALVLGFLTPGEPVKILANGRWTRASTARGHVLVRAAATL